MWNTKIIITYKTEKLKYDLKKHFHVAEIFIFIQKITKQRTAKCYLIT
jgi:hypothetical protein